MTASLPVPSDAPSNEPDGARSGARRNTGTVQALPTLPELPAQVAAGDVAAASDAPTEAVVEPPTAEPAPKPTPKPRAKRAARKRPAAKSPVVDPGPPPPLPPDLAGVVIPPRPPLPVPVPVPVETVAEPEREGASALEPVLAAESEPDVAEPALASEPERVEVPAGEAEVEADPAVELDELIAASVIPVDETAVATEPAAERERDIDVVGDIAIDTATAALVVKGVAKNFGGTRAVDGIDLTVPAGTFYGLVGPNGAGKTTTLSIIAGLLRPDRGSISVNGVDAIADPVAAKRQMGVLPDRLRTFDRLTGRQLLHYYGVLRGLSSAVVESRTADLARAFDLTDALGRVVSDYSAGMAKKVMLAGALIHSPRLLVLDEPFEAVDPVSSAIILDILSTYVAHGGTVILSSHGMELVERHCSRVAVIVAGQVLAEGTVEEVRGELTLEQRFIELAGGLSDVEGLEWLHTFSN
ncbi:ABC-2 type transport system ATP-binding protein [Microbacterium pygmaeum]|uniref:ABC-2 type transport system ATP-binding protein n=2 Tax=Microbacterium pygmaeum TaxID=370764 RepID=A0A1G7ZL70_9MICO|nr:ABC-2 type transport system ATP-binding protein [Microbacterium pygmaeum]